MRRWSIPVLDIFGIHFRLHFSFPLMFCLVWILESGRGPQVGLRSFLLMAMVAFAVMSHEMGHALMAARHGIKVRSVVLLPIAGIALLDEQTPVVALLNDVPGRDKTLSNVQECRARHAPVIGIASEGDVEVASLVPDCIFVPRTGVYTTPIVAVVALQPC